MNLLEALKFVGRDSPAAAQTDSSDPARNAERTDGLGREFQMSCGLFRGEKERILSIRRETGVGFHCSSFVAVSERFDALGAAHVAPPTSRDGTSFRTPLAGRAHRR